MSFGSTFRSLPNAYTVNDKNHTSHQCRDCVLFTGGDSFKELGETPTQSNVKFVKFQACTTARGILLMCKMQLRQSQVHYGLLTVGIVI